MISPSSAHLGQSLMLCLWVAVIGCSDRPTAIVEIPPGAARNVILISLDTVRADHLSAYGYERATSPSLDGVATQGALFRNAVAVSPWTRPSHTTLLTGVYPLLHGARSWDTTLSDSVPTLAEIFERDGWRTGGVVGTQLLDESSGLSRGFETYEYIREWHGPDDGARKARNAGNLVTDEALSWLSDRDNRRFFLFLHYYDVHSNYAAQTKYQRMFDREPQRSEIDGSTSQLLEVLDGKRKLSEPDLGKLVALYDAEIRQLDDEIRRLLRFLDEEDLRSSTLIVLTSDHGEEFMEHGSVLHASTYYSEVIDIPLIMAGPGVPAEREVKRPVSHIDVAPTLLSLTGLPIPKNMVGIDLSRTWGEDSPPWRDRYLFAEADHSNETPDQFRMVLGPRHKLIFDRQSETTELYDLTEDPGEQRDISSEQPDLVKSHLKALADFESMPEATGEKLELTKDQIEALRELGYMN